ncbi:EPIDERMAL PATTERNING FACTOR-like protein 2 [Panicum miliaceum]|uniref:Epidermal patterning factor-like protein n=1 Tax=Panicum miliaceum TaxID=4540 RepID=A0A3L6TK63_PANMI|nr:EPIDERMAL PATTERNING FACTOR-like protein 2 [Panicum miliaceum]
MGLQLYSSSLLLLLLLLSSHGLHAAEGRALHFQPKDPAKVSNFLSSGSIHALSPSPAPWYMRTNQLLLLAVGDVEQIGKGVAVAESLIGSRPPRCEGKCAPCGRCEAVQVPVAPRVDGGRGEAQPGRARLFGSAAGDRVQESYTDYKPLNWKCRCADRRALDP